MRMTELLKSVFVDVYRLDYSQLFLLLLAATACFLFLHKRYRENRLWRFFLGAVLLVWTALVVYYTVGSRGGSYTGDYNLIPFHSYRKLFETGVDEILRTNFMNLVLFYPAGVLTASLLPENWSRIPKILSVGIAFSLFSLVIEYVQFSYSLGEPEIDDVIHNMLGSIIGTIPIILSESSS